MATLRREVCIVCRASRAAAPNTVQSCRRTVAGPVGELGRRLREASRRDSVINVVIRFLGGSGPMVPWNDAVNSPRRPAVLPGLGLTSDCRPSDVDAQGPFVPKRMGGYAPKPPAVRKSKIEETTAQATACTVVLAQPSLRAATTASARALMLDQPRGAATVTTRTSARWHAFRHRLRAPWLWPFQWRQPR